MWLTKKETAEKAESVKTGVVTTGGGEISVCTELERRAPTVTVPYGMAVSVPQGTEAVMTGGVCLGVVNDAGTLLPGEVRLFSAGGAEIVLKLDGTVVIRRSHPVTDAPCPRLYRQDNILGSSRLSGVDGKGYLFFGRFCII